MGHVVFAIALPIGIFIACSVFSLLFLLLIQEWTRLIVPPLDAHFIHEDGTPGGKRFHALRAGSSGVILVRGVDPRIKLPHGLTLADEVVKSTITAYLHNHHSPHTLTPNMTSPCMSICCHKIHDQGHDFLSLWILLSCYKAGRDYAVRYGKAVFHAQYFADIGQPALEKALPFDHAAGKIAKTKRHIFTVLYIDGRDYLGRDYLAPYNSTELSECVRRNLAAGGSTAPGTNGAARSGGDSDAGGQQGPKMLDLGAGYRTLSLQEPGCSFTTYALHVVSYLNMERRWQANCTGEKVDAAGLRLSLSRAVSLYAPEAALQVYDLWLVFLYLAVVVVVAAAARLWVFVTAAKLSGGADEVEQQTVQLLTQRQAVQQQTVRQQEAQQTQNQAADVVGAGPADKKCE